jgi:tRNA threonylcarbamoyl adenosine modification protein YeaZ
VLLLAFDTATPAVTVALHDGAVVQASETEQTPRRHGEVLASMIARVLSAAGAARTDLTAIAVGTGPGPYTGLRAGLVTARVLGSALRIPVLGVCTLDVMAREAVPAAAGREFIVAADARRKEVYWARYAPAGLRLTDPAVSFPAEVAAAGQGDGRPGPVAGAGPELYAELGACPIPPRYPGAAQLAQIAAERLAERGAQNHGARSPGGPGWPEPAEPLYLRRPDARVPGPPKRVLPC